MRPPWRRPPAAPRRFEVAPAGTITIRHDVVHEHKPRPLPQYVTVRVMDGTTAEYLGQLAVSFPGQTITIPPGWLQRVAEHTLGNGRGIDLVIGWEG